MATRPRKRRKRPAPAKKKPPAKRAPKKQRPSVAQKRKRFALAFTDPTRDTFCNGTQSAIAAGYAKKSAHVTASRLLNDAKVQAQIRERVARAAAQADFTSADFIVKSLKQCDSWLDEEGKPLERPLVHEGAVVKHKGAAIVERWRPNETNRKALEMAGIAAGHIGRTGEVGGSPGGPIAGALAGVVNNIYIGAELPPTRKPARLEEIE